MGGDSVGADSTQLDACLIGNYTCISVHQGAFGEDGLLKPMERAHIIQILQNHRQELAEQFGVHSLALFGSFSRDEAVNASDVDLLVEFSRPVGYFGLVALQDHLAQLLDHPVDIGTLASLKPRIRRRVEREMLGVF
jgi:predicted nucleotidyltransferase